LKLLVLSKYMKLTQAELDLLPSFQSQLTDIRVSLRAFEIFTNDEPLAVEARREFVRMNNDLSFMVSTMQRYIDKGAQ
jgi:hypothetical protein